MSESFEGRMVDAAHVYAKATLGACLLMLPDACDMFRLSPLDVMIAAAGGQVVAMANMYKRMHGWSFDETQAFIDRINAAVTEHFAGNDAVTVIQAEQ